MSPANQRTWLQHPVVAVVGLISALIALFSFFTGITSFVELLETIPSDLPAIPDRTFFYKTVEFQPEYQLDPIDVDIRAAILIGLLGIPVGVVLARINIFIPQRMMNEFHEQSINYFEMNAIQHPVPSVRSKSYKFVVISTTVGMFFLLAWQFSELWHVLFGLAFVSLLIPLAFIGEDHRLLPDVLTYPLMYLGFFASTFGIFTSPFASIVGATAGYAFLRAAREASFRSTGGEGIGFGDMKLFAALGAWGGYEQLMLVLLLMANAGLAEVFLRKFVFRNLYADFPLATGPYWAIAGVVSLLWGDQLILLWSSLSAE